jgi:CO/xanthine dehydrogenase FAD-binding subunit
LIVLGATLDIVGPDAHRSLPIEALYGKDGTDHIQLEAGELITTVRVPIPPAHTRLAYRKWAVRKSIDFPLISVATRLDMDPSDPTTVEGGVIAVNALGPKPRVIPLKNVQGRTLDESLAEELGAMVAKRCKPLPNIPYDPVYRRRRLGVEVKRAIRSLFGEAQ